MDANQHLSHQPAAPQPPDELDSQEPRHLDSQAPGHLLPSWADLRAIGLVTAAAVAVALFWWWTGRPVAETVIPAQQTRLSSQEQPSLTNPSPRPILSDGVSTKPTAENLQALAESQIVVDVRGGVRNRGIQRLPAGSRVVDAIAAAGGLRSGSSNGGINLAAVLIDGQQIVVSKNTTTGTPNQVNQQAAGPDKATGSATPRSSPIGLNSATAAELESLPGVGPVLANRIIDWREQNGDFRSVDDLIDVSGIGVKVLEGLRKGAQVG